MSCVGVSIFSESEHRVPRGQALVIGEVLYDQLPHGKNVLGGAPFNVAWNLQAFGQQPVFISAVGHDDLGDSIRNTMFANSMTDAGLQTNEKSTGVVKVNFVDGQPQYQIVEDQAYDHISYDSQLVAQQNLSVIYHGSLAWRNPTTRDTILKFRQAVNAPIFVDLNIREPWFDAAWLPELLHGVDSLKLNTDELHELVVGSSFSEHDNSGNRSQQIFDSARQLIQQYEPRCLWVTDGANGAYFISRNGEPEFEPAIELEGLADTIGAGDAFSSAVISGWINGDDEKHILKKATRFAAKVCTLNGATTNDSNFY